MKKLSVILCVLLVIAMLAGCGDTTKEFTCKNLTMTVPGYMVDASNKADFAAYTFTLDSNKIAVFGLQETYAEYPILEEYDLKGYTELCIEGNGLDSRAIERSTADYYYFEYSANNPDGVYTYMTGCFQSEDGYWIVQICSKATDYEKETFLGYLDSVRFS